MENYVLLRLVYVANILVAGSIAYTSLTNPTRAAATIFEHAYPATEVIRLVGCLWLAIAILSVGGLFRPVAFSPVLLLQMIYKGTFLLVVSWPAIRAAAAYPRGMSGFFLVWVLVLPFVIPWGDWLARG